MTTRILRESLTQEEVTPYALKALESFREASLTTGQVFRLADNLAVQNGETRYMSSQLVRMTLLSLVQAGAIHRREATTYDGSPYRSNQIVWLHSASHPVPVWSAMVNAQIEEHTPPSRMNPNHNPTGRRPDGTPPKPRAATADGTGASGRADLIVTLVTELARDADAGASAAQLREENARLVRTNEQLVAERNDAVKKARALERVYRTMGKLLDDVPDTPG